MFALAGCGETERSAQSVAAQQEPVSVRVAPVQWQSVQRGIDVTGTLFGDEEAVISAKAAGRIVAVHKDLGDAVEPGELLAQVDRIDYELTRAQGEAALLEALARLGLDELPGDGFDVSPLPSVQRAAAEEANARVRFERGRQLFTDDPPLISEQEFADLETALEVASRNVKVEMLLAEALLSQARTRALDLRFAEQRLLDTEIRAPRRDGAGQRYAVAERRIAVGEYVTEGQAAFALVDADPIKFRAEAPDRYVGAVQVGQEATVLVEAFPQPFAGRVARVAPRVNLQSRTFVVETEVPNPEGRLKPGSFARGHIATTVEASVAFVPDAAVVSFAGVKRIFTVENGRAVEHRITTGLAREAMVEVIGAKLSPGAMVIVEGATRVSAGTPLDASAAPTEAQRDSSGSTVES